MDEQLPNRLSTLRDQGVTKPILVGIGVSTTDQVKHAMDSGAQGVVIGSMTLVKAMEGQAALEDYLCDIRNVLSGD